MAIGFDRIMEICEAKPVVPKSIVVVSFEDTRKEAIIIAQKLRTHIATYLDVMGRKFKDQIAYANTIGASHVVIVGKNELDAGKVALKDMSTGEQELLSVEEVVRKLS
jgi:histidyl-tRNA synthetase